MDRFYHEVRLRIGSPAESSAQVRGVDLHFFSGKSGDLGCIHSIDGLKLLSRPDLAGVCPQVDSTIQGLHHRVRKIRDFIDRFSLLGSRGECSLRIAFFAHALSRRLGLFAKLLHHLRSAEATHRALVPIDLKGITSHLGLPE